MEHHLETTHWNPPLTLLLLPVLNLLKYPQLLPAQQLKAQLNHGIQNAGAAEGLPWGLGVFLWFGGFLLGLALFFICFVVGVLVGFGFVVVWWLLSRAKRPAAKKSFTTNQHF